MGLVVILFIVRFCLNYVSKFSLRLVGIRLSAAIRMHYLSSLLDQTVHVLDTMPPGSAAGTITSAANTLQIGISEKLGTFVEFASTIIAAIIVAFTYSWRVTLVTFSAVLFIGMAVGTILPFIIKGMSRHTRSETKASAVATEAFSAIRMIYACGAQKRMADRYARYVTEAKMHGMSTSPFMATQFGLIFFGLYGAFALCFWYGTRAYAQGQVSGGISTIVVVLFNVFLMAMSLERMSTPLIAASKATVAAATFFAVIDTPKPDRGHLKDPEVSAGGDIVFDGVTFAYPGRPSTKVLDDLSVTIRAGKVTAIVGPSGSGKSTIVGLVEKWYSLHDQVVIERAVGKDPKKKKKKKKAAEDGGIADSPGKDEKKSFWAKFKPKASPSDDDDDDENDDYQHGTKEEQDSGPPVQLSGSIMTAAHNLDEIDVKWWRSQIGLVQQEPFLFNDSIYTNVMHGLVGTQWENAPLEVKQELAREACKEAFADEFVDKLPDVSLSSTEFLSSVARNALARRYSGYKNADQLLSLGLQHPGWRFGLEALWWTETAAGHREKYRQEAKDSVRATQNPGLMPGHCAGKTEAKSLMLNFSSILDEATSAIDVRSEKIIQAALDRVSKGRTTIMIAHRLSTIAQADNIVVLKKGRLIEQGTHQDLLRDEEGVYSGLVRAQKLTFGKETHEEDNDEQEQAVQDVQAVLSRKKSAASATEGLDQTAVESSWKNKGLIGSFGRLLWEQRTRLPNYALILISCGVIAAGLPLQAFLFAQVINVFILPVGGGFLSRAAWYSLMWFVLAICVGFGYFMMGFVATSLQFFICAAYRQQYFTALIRQRIAFFDAEDNSVGSLTARVQGDPKQRESSAVRPTRRLYTDCLGLVDSGRTSWDEYGMCRLPVSDSMLTSANRPLGNGRDIGLPVARGPAHRLLF